MRRKFLKLGLVFSGLLFCGAVATKAVAHEHGGRGAFMQSRISAKLDAALDDAKVTQQQRDQIHAIRDRLFKTMADQHKDGRSHMESALHLFEADRIDQQEVTRLRAEQEARHKAAADQFQAALTEVHDLLTPEQRKALADHVRNQAGHFFQAP